jgi:broad specificity phosphatase PhoE
MKDRILYLVRHGQRLDSIQKQWYSPDENQYDPPLSPEGMGQAYQIAQRLQAEPIDFIFSSPYLRALQTAHPIAEALNLPLYVEAGIGEWLGRGMIPLEPNITPAYQRHEEFPRLEFLHNTRLVPHWPETVEECFARLKNTIQQLLESYEGNLLIVGHGRTVTGLAHVLTQKPESQFKYGLAALSTLRLHENSWQIELNSDESHLKEDPVTYFV